MVTVLNAMSTKQYVRKNSKSTTTKTHFLIYLHAYSAAKRPIIKHAGAK
jgi:hypothetical protein